MMTIFSKPTVQTISSFLKVSKATLPPLQEVFIVMQNNDSSDLEKIIFEGA